MKDVAPSLRVLVGGEDHRPAANVSVVDDVIEDVGRVVAVREVADLVEMCIRDSSCAAHFLDVKVTNL